MLGSRWAFFRFLFFPMLISYFLSVIFSVHVSMNEQTYYLSARVINSLYVGADGDAVDTSIVYVYNISPDQSPVHFTMF